MAKKFNRFQLSNYRDCSKLVSNPLLATDCRIELLYADIDGQAAMYPKVV